MTGRSPDQRVVDFLRSGPEAAPAEFVEATLLPIPRMRQRRSWRIWLDRIVQPIASPVSAAVGLAVVVAGIAVVAGLPGLVGDGRPGASAPAVPTFELTIRTGPGGSDYLTPGAGSHAMDPTASLNLCTHAADGSWRYLYAGGTPYGSLDMLIGPAADRLRPSDDVAVELEAGGTYVRFDPSVLRGGDQPGRSEASLVIEERDGSTTFIVSALTPDRTSGEDGPPLQVELTVTCPD